MHPVGVLKSWNRDVFTEWIKVVQMTQVLIIDGYNLLYQFPELRKKAERDIVGAREDLVSYLFAYSKHHPFEMIVVFDGDGRTEVEPINVRNVRVVFSILPEKADPLIRRMIHEKVKKSSVTVVTSDNEIIQDARMSGAAVIASQTFASRRLSEDGGVNGRKYDHPMNQDELDEWVRLFQKGQKKD